eukprot:SAG31_NODE_913_length_11064_cov_4.529594_8_plen_74_part_00
MNEQPSGRFVVGAPNARSVDMAPAAGLAAKAGLTAAVLGACVGLNAAAGRAFEKSLRGDVALVRTAEIGQIRG